MKLKSGFFKPIFTRFNVVLEVEFDSSYKHVSMDEQIIAVVYLFVIFVFIAKKVMWRVPQFAENIFSPTFQKRFELKKNPLVQWYEPEFTFDIYQSIWNFASGWKMLVIVESVGKKLGNLGCALVRAVFNLEKLFP